MRSTYPDPDDDEVPRVLRMGTVNDIGLAAVFLCSEVRLSAARQGDLGGPLSAWGPARRCLSVSSLEGGGRAWPHRRTRGDRPVGGSAGTRCRSALPTSSTDGSTDKLN